MTRLLCKLDTNFSEIFRQKKQKRKIMDSKKKNLGLCAVFFYNNIANL